MNPFPHDESLERRLWSKTDRSAGDSGCWHWSGGIFTDNAGRPRAGGIAVREVPRTGHGNDMATRQAHRVAYEFLIGPLSPDDMLIRMCETPVCVNPGHYMKGTPADLGALMSDGADTCGRGHPYTPENTSYPKGKRSRVCKACAALRRRADRRAQALGYKPVHRVERQSSTCPKGHLVTGNNALYLPSCGRTICRECNNESNRAWHERSAVSA